MEQFGSVLPNSLMPASVAKVPYKVSVERFFNSPKSSSLASVIRVEFGLSNLEFLQLSHFLKSRIGDLGVAQVKPLEIPLLVTFFRPSSVTLV